MKLILISLHLLIAFEQDDFILLKSLSSQTKMGNIYFMFSVFVQQVKCLTLSVKNTEISLANIFHFSITTMEYTMYGIFYAKYSIHSCKLQIVLDLQKVA